MSKHSKGFILGAVFMLVLSAVVAVAGHSRGLLEVDFSWSKCYVWWHSN